MLILKSSVPGLVWPAVPDEVGLLVHAYLAQLDQSQWLGAQELAAMQARQLASRLGDARVHCTLFRERLAGAPFATEGNARAILASLPLLTRSQLQDLADSVYSAAVPEAHGRVKSNSTSGSTGQPVNVRSTAMSRALRLAFLLRGMLWHGLDFSRSIAMVRSMVAVKDVNQALEQDGWGLPVTMLYESGRAYAANVSMPIPRQMEWLESRKPDYLMTYPTILGALIEHSRRPPPNLKRALTLGETLADEVVRAARETWAVEVVDSYSSEEFGPIAIQCAPGGRYHVMAEGLVVEILRDDGSPCRPGETGRVVVTDLQNFATGMIRYETGDHAEVGGPCACGRGLPTLARILGRTRNMITLPDGSRRWPRIGLSQYRKDAPIKQFQLIQHTPKELELRLHVARPLSAEEKGAVVSGLQKRLGYAFAVELILFDHPLPRAANGKFETFMSLV